jgi:hypothetical protein
MFENPTINLSALCNSSAKIAWCSSEFIFTILYAHRSIQNACEQFVSCIQLSCVNFPFHPNPHTHTNRTDLDREPLKALSQ